MSIDAISSSDEVFTSSTCELRDVERTSFGSFFQYLQSLFGSLSPDGATYIFDKDKTTAELTRALQSVIGDKYVGGFGTRIVKSFTRAVEVIDQTQGLSAEELYQKKERAAQEARIKLGSLVYMFQNDPEATRLAVKTENPSVEIKNLRITTMLGNISDNKADSAVLKKIGIENSTLALEVAISREISRMLITDEGLLNLGMISIVKKTYVPLTNATAWQTKLGEILDHMDSSWQETLDSIEKPANNLSFINDLIRAELEISPTVPITDVDTKRVALGALFSSMPAGLEHPPVTIAWELKRWNDRPLDQLKDLGSVAQHAYIARHNIPFFIVESLDTSKLSASLFIAPDGKIQGTNTLLWDYPTIASAAKQMGIEDPAQVGAVVLVLLGRRTVTIDEVLRTFAAVAEKGGIGNAVTLLKKGILGAMHEPNRLLEVALSALQHLGATSQGNSTTQKVSLCASLVI